MCIAQILLHSPASKFGSGVGQQALAWSTVYVTFLPYALERRASGEDWAVDTGSILVRWFYYSTNQASFSLSGTNFATYTQKICSY